MNQGHSQPEEFPDPNDAEGSSLDELLNETGDILSDPALATIPATARRGDSTVEQTLSLDDESSLYPRPLREADVNDSVNEDSADALLDELATEFVARYRDGERPSIAEYVKKHPDLAEEIRDLFPTIAQMEGLKIQVDEEERLAHEDVNASHGPVPGELKLTQLGDFRIIREIGRGGMGIVYEAEQTSLKRRVAVKVLPLLSLLKPELLQRFDREARTAAQLHHTNIVPVFGFGQFRGFHYYVMQLIEGIGLDELLLDRFDTEERSSVSDRSDSSRTDADAEEFSSVDATDVCRAAPSSDGSFTTASAFTSRSAEETLAEQSAARLDLADSSPAASTEVTEIGSAPSSDAATVTRLANRQNPLLGTKLDVKSIADIGAQAASALAYAHDQGTLHRDIKPGNLLMDEGGQVWVADFGLAKAMEGDEITQSGNVVGTVRYMAPEQLRGETDPRSDVYALGITLYELLTGHRAWSATERNSLIQQVLHSDLTPPGKVNPEVPRDLETIVVKATAREPEHRYQTAAELEADLRCFLEDRPISARRISELERLIRWSRRNPVVASLSGATVLLLALVAIVGFIGYQAERAQRTRAEETSTLALNALDQIFDRFAPDQAVVLTSSASGGAGGRSSPAVVSDETAALLEDLLKFYDQLGESDDDDVQLAIKRAEARRRVGDIRQRLGRHSNAISSYEQSLERYDTLVERLPDQKASLTVIQARILNGIGTSQRMINQQDEATESHRQALETLEMLPAEQLALADAQFELARSHYLLAWRLRPGESPVDSDSQLVLPEDLDDGPPRPGGGPGEFRPGGRPAGNGPAGGGPGRRGVPQSLAPGEVTAEQVTHFSQAVEILTPLRSEFPENPKFAHLLAICLREWYPSRIPDDESPIEGQEVRPEELLEDLVKRFPRTLEFRHALAETYSHYRFHPGELELVNLYRVETALTKALKHARSLYEDQPTVPAYTRSLIQIHFQLATTQQSFPRFLGPDRRDEAQQFFAKAELNFRAAEDSQRVLVRRFSDSLSYHLWLARYQRSLGVVLQMQRRWDDARDKLLDAIEEAENINSELRDTDSWHLAISSLHRELSFAYRELGEQEKELEQLFQASDHYEQVQDQSLLDSRPRRRGQNGPRRPFNQGGPPARRFERE